MSLQLAALCCQTAKNVQEFVFAAVETILLSLSSPIDDVVDNGIDQDDEATTRDQVRQVYYAMPLKFFERLRIPIESPNGLTKQGVQVSIFVLFFSGSNNSTKVTCSHCYVTLWYDLKVPDLENLGDDQIGVPFQLLEQE